MKPEQKHFIAVKLKAVSDLATQLETLIASTEFSDDENREEALDEIASVLVSLDGIGEILDTDAECAILKKELES